jgi:hypothetical protein
VRRASTRLFFSCAWVPGTVLAHRLTHSLPRTVLIPGLTHLPRRAVLILRLIRRNNRGSLGTQIADGTDGKGVCRLGSHRDLGFFGDSRDCFPEALCFRKLRLGSGKPACLFTDKVFVIHAGETPLSGFGVCFHPLNGFLGVFAGTIHPTSRWSGRLNSDTALKIRTIATGKKKIFEKHLPKLGIKQRLRRLAEHLSSLNQRAG